MDYKTLTAADKAAILRDTLRGQETDHVRLSAMVEAGLPGATAARVAEIEQGMVTMYKQVTDAENKVAKEAKND
jgi:hypothetical protein